MVKNFNYYLQYPIIIYDKVQNSIQKINITFSFMVLLSRRSKVLTRKRPVPGSIKTSTEGELI